MTARTSRNTAALVGVCLASLMFGLEISSVPVILPTLETALKADFKALQWIMNAYTIACTTVLMATGALADRFGRKRVMVIVTIGFALASLLCGVAQSAPLLIAARFLQGLTGGAMFLCTVAVLSHQFQEGAERSRAFIAWGMISGVGLGFGPIIGGLITSLADWRWVFIIHAPLSVLALGLIAVGVRESRDPQAKRLDAAGVVTLSLAVFGFSYLITQGADLGLAARVIAAVAAATALVAFLVVERINPHPMFDFSVFRIRQFSGAIVGCIGMNFSYWPFIIYLPIYFTSGLGYDSTQAGLLLLAYTLPFMAGPPVGERLRQRFGARVAISLGLTTIGVGLIAMKIGSSAAHADWLTVLPGALIAGAGIGITNTPTTNTTTASVSADRAGMASGIDISARLIALAINIAVMGAVLVAGVAAHLKGALGGSLDPNATRALAEKIAAGDLSALSHLAQTVGAAPALARAALVDGFGWVMLYGGIGVIVLAGLAFLVFGPERAGQTEPQQAEPRLAEPDAVSLAED